MLLSLTNILPNSIKENYNYCNNFFTYFVPFAYTILWIVSCISPLFIVILWSCNFMFTSLLLTFLPLIFNYIPQKYDLRSDNFKQSISSYIDKFYNIEYIFPENLQLSEKNLFCMHPHGIYPQGWICIAFKDKFHNFTFCISSILYSIPIVRTICRFFSKINSVNKETMKDLMNSKKNIALLPGGFEEATIHCSEKDRIYIKKRTGFIAYAMKYNYSITPAYCFGERNTFYNVQGFWDFRLWLNKFYIPAVIPWGNFILPIFPKRTKLKIVIGEPIKIESNMDIMNSKEVEYYHQLYIKAIQDIYDKYAPEFYGEDYSRLEIW